MTTQIKRKAVPKSSPIDTDSDKLGTAESVLRSFDVVVLNDGSKENEKSGPILEDGESRPDFDFDEQLQNLQLEDGDIGHSPLLPDALITEEPSVIPQDGATASRASKFKTALGEVKHFAGGIISRPYEATKHYSILRHGHGLVYYEGPTTSVAITVLSDQPLPPDRTLWLQKRGFSGKTGQRIGTLGTRSAWIDVTPSFDATPDLLPKDNERAWQRDIAKFLKKAKDTKRICNHRPYETNVVRIPHVADDGYLRIVLCAGRKVLCPSPGFRYASSSLDPSILRGASLSTLPMELGIWIGSMVAHTAAHSAASGALQPAMSTLKTITQPYQLSGVTQWAATAAYDASGTAEKVHGTIESFNQQYDEKQELSNTIAVGETVETAKMVGAEEGPDQPFPTRFSGKVAVRSGNGHRQLDATTVNLVNVPQNTLLRLAGAYMAWASISPPKDSNGSPVLDGSHDVWHQAVVIVAADIQKEVQVVQQKSIYVHLLHDFGEAILVKAKLSLMLMAFLHPADEMLPAYTPVIEHQHDQLKNDIATTKLSLNRTSWQPDAVLERVKTTLSARSFSKRFADARQTGQKQWDRIPVHKLGVRTDSMKWKDDLIGTGGLCIKRQGEELTSPGRPSLE